MLLKKDESAPAPLVKSVAHHPSLLVTIAHNAAHDFNASEVTVSYNFSRADNELLSSLDWKSILERNCGANFLKYFNLRY